MLHKLLAGSWVATQVASSEAERAAKEPKRAVKEPKRVVKKYSMQRASVASYC
jgi:hypothetical protein